MTSSQVDAKLTELLGLPAESEWVEFKEAKNDYHFDRLPSTTTRKGTSSRTCFRR